MLVGWGLSRSPLSQAHSAEPHGDYAALASMKIDDTSLLASAKVSDTNGFPEYCGISRYGRSAPLVLLASLKI
jgi:hypothetical protein